MKCRGRGAHVPTCNNHEIFHSFPLFDILAHSLHQDIRGKVNCIIFKRLRTLCQKHPGWGTPHIARLRRIERFDMQKHFLAGVIVAAAVLVTLAPSPVSSSRAAAPADQTAILVGAGDIADCKDLSGAEATAKLLVQVPGTVMASVISPTRMAAKKISHVTTRLGAA